MSSTHQIKWGILGTAWISGVIAEAIAEAENAELMAVASRDADKAARFATQFNAPTWYADYEQLLLDPSIDAVYIGLPNHLHVEWIVRCAQAGKHILCEKPLVLNRQEANTVFAAVEQYKVFCMEALMYRCHPIIQQLQDLLATKVIGDIQTITAVYTADIAAKANTIAGGAIRNLGCYPISLVRLLTQEEPINIIAQGKLDADDRNDHLSIAILNFKNGIIATITTADNIEMWSQFTVFGSKGILDLKCNPWLPGKTNQVYVRTMDKEKTLTFEAKKSLYTYQIEVSSQQIIRKFVRPEAPGVTQEHSVGNTAVVADWLQQVKNNACKINVIDSQKVTSV